VKSDIHKTVPLATINFILAKDKNESRVHNWFYGCQIDYPGAHLEWNTFFCDQFVVEKRSSCLNEAISEGPRSALFLNIVSSYPKLEDNCRWIGNLLFSTVESR
jgi:hypothetical protein